MLKCEPTAFRHTGLLWSGVLKMLMCSQYTVVLSDISLFSPGEVRTRRTGEWTVFRENQ